MQTSTSAPSKAKSGARKRIAVGDRVTFAGTVLRVLPGDQRPLPIMVDANGIKLTINSHWIPGGEKLKGSDPVSLAGKVTLVGTSANDDAVPISMAVDGYSLSRVTLGARHVSQEK